MVASFEVPQVAANESGWGPTTVPEQLDGVPYAPFGKGDKIGRVSDFTAAGLRYGARFQNQREPGVAVFNFFHDNDEDSFHLVDSRPVQRNRGGPRRFQPNRFQQQQRRQQEEAAAAAATAKRQPRKQQQKRNFQHFQRNDQRQMVYSSSVDIRPEWAVAEQIPFTALTKLHSALPELEDVRFAGSLRYYDKAYDRVTPKADKPLRPTRAAFRDVTVSDDPVIKKLAEEGAAQVFMSDTVLTTLMCAPRSVYSWDVLITKEGGKLFFDTREGYSLSTLTVAETAPEAVAEDKDSINGVQQLSQEATAINQAFSQQVLSEEPAHECGSPDPFADAPPTGGAAPASVAYRYRKAALGSEQQLVVRCGVDGVMHFKDGRQLLLIKALNEFDPKLTGVDWRQKIENQRGAVLATELKNNANKLAKWTAAALVAGVDVVKLGYVARAHPRDPHRHVILSTQAVKPRDFAMQINLSMENCWGIVRALVDVVNGLDDGKWLLVKDPNKQLLRLYSVPADAFKEDWNEESPAHEDEALPVVSAPAGDDKDDD